MHMEKYKIKFLQQQIHKNAFKINYKLMTEKNVKCFRIMCLYLQEGKGFLGQNKINKAVEMKIILN